MGFNQFSDEYTFLPASGVDIEVPGQQERKTSREVTNTPKDNSDRGCPCVLGAGRVWVPFRHKRETALGRLSRNVVGGASIFFPIGAGALLACNFIVLGAVPQVPAASLCEFAVIANFFYSLVSHCKPLLSWCARLLQQKH